MGKTGSADSRAKGGNGIVEGVIWKQLLLFFFPILFGTFFQQLYNTADAMIVGRFVGKEALSAVGGSTGSLINLLVGFFVGLSSGATVIISQYYGAKRDKDVSDSVHTAIALSAAGGGVIMVVGILFAPIALRAMGVPGEILGYAVTYMRIYFAGMIPNLIYNMGAGILRAVGDSRRPLYFLIASCFANILLDLLFVVCFRWEIVGVALATVLSQVLSAGLVCLVLSRSHDSFRLNLLKLRMKKKLLLQIVRIGLPAGIQSVMYSLSNVLIQSNVNAFGTNTIAAMTAYGKIDGLFWMMIGAFGVSITTFVGQNYGADRPDRVKKGVKVCMAMAFGATAVMSTVLYFGGQYVYRLFTTDEAVIAKGLEILHFLVPLFFTYVAIEILSGALRGIGDSLVPMIITCLGVCGLRIVWLMAAVPVWPSIITVVASYPITWSVTSILFIIYYRHSKMRNL